MVVASDADSLVHVIVGERCATHYFDLVRLCTAFQAQTAPFSDRSTLLWTQGGTVLSEHGNSGLLQVIVEGVGMHHLFVFVVWFVPVFYKNPAIRSTKGVPGIPIMQCNVSACVTD